MIGGSTVIDSAILVAQYHSMGSDMHKSYRHKVLHKYRA